MFAIKYLNGYIDGIYYVNVCSLLYNIDMTVCR
jgi:hypothetical protein